MNDLKKDIININNLVKKEYKPINHAYPIYDGIINEEQFISAKYKILWILKESYDDKDKNGNAEGGGWNMVKDINNRTEEYSKIKTWQQIIYCCYGILNDFIKYDPMDYYYEKHMYEVLKKIAVINIQKIAALTKSYDSLIFSSYEEHKNLLIKQIDIIKPNIIIGGNTLKYFKNDLRFNKLENNDMPVNHYFNKEQLYIDAYHPSRHGAQVGIKKREYVDSIIETTENWIKWRNLI